MLCAIQVTPSISTYLYTWPSRLSVSIPSRTFEGGKFTDGDEVAEEEDEELLASCYRSCLSLADENGVKSIAFCCISTGEFHFPNRRAAEIAVKTVRDYRRENNSEIEVVFNVWKDIDDEIYRELLG